MLYQQIEQNKRNTWLVMGAFALLMGVICFLLSYYLNLYLGLIFLAIAIIYLVYIYWYAVKHLMKVTHAVIVKREDAPELYEMVEEMAIAAGIPMPEVYIVPTPIPNAFATGRDPEHASLAVTTGLLKIMDKKELLGVIGHEMSHIRNYDIRVTMIASALSRFIYLAAVILSVTGWEMFNVKSDSMLVKGIGWFLGAACLMVGVPLFLFALPIAKLLSLAMSRQREYLADIGSVDLTRDPTCITSSLKKLQSYEAIMSNAQREEAGKQEGEVSAMAFNTYAVKHWWTNLISDHPTLDKRIERLSHTADV